MSKSTVSTVDFNIMSKNDGSLGADNNSDKSFERVHLNVSSNSVENVTGSKLSKNAFSSAVENITDVDVSHTSDSCSLSHQSKFLNISSRLTNNITDAKIGLQEMKRNSPDRLILGHVNINSIRNKFDALTYIIGNNIDIILISEKKSMIHFLQLNFLLKVLVLHTDRTEIGQVGDYFYLFREMYHQEF